MVPAGVGDQADVPVAPRPAPVCEVCAHNPVKVTVTNHRTLEHHQYCSGCYFILHPIIKLEHWP